MGILFVSYPSVYAMKSHNEISYPDLMNENLHYCKIPRWFLMHICIPFSVVSSPEFEKHSFNLQMVSGGIRKSELLWPLVGWVPGWHAHLWRKAGSQAMWTDS